MPATAARTGLGTKLYRGDGAVSETFTALPEVLDVNGPGTSLMTEDATHMESPNGYVEKIGTVKEAGTVTFQMHLQDNEALLVALQADLDAPNLRNFRLVHPSGTRRKSYAAWVTSIEPSYPVKGKMTYALTLTPTGKVITEAHS